VSHIYIFSINLSLLSKNLLSHHCEEYSRLAPNPISLSKTKTSLFGILKTHKNKKVYEIVTVFFLYFSDRI